LEFAWSPHNIDQWDPEKTGVLWGRQHHTLDMELFGPNSWLTGMYLGALKAAAEMAAALGESESAAEYEAIFRRGKAWVDEHLFNGEYYYQRIDLNDRTLIEAYHNDQVLQGGSTLNAYWTAEHGEIKYQIGEGSSIDQVLGQWHASLYGLGDLFDPAQVGQANAAIYKYNYIARMGDVYNPCRIYCLNDEGGLVICAWPEGAQKPVIPAPYSQETMNGFEYAAAIHMIMTGMVQEGITCIEAVRRRYDGERRNPWNEFECGSNYARSMASYALLNAFSGFEFDMTQGMIGFNPLPSGHRGWTDTAGSFRCFWSLDSGWGEFVLTPDRAELIVHYGTLTLRTLRLPFLAGRAVGGINLEGSETGFSQEAGEINLAEPALLTPHQRLCVTL
jgi:uncharacterized protein (DUF608 family)